MREEAELFNFNGTLGPQFAVSDLHHDLQAPVALTHPSSRLLRKTFQLTRMCSSFCDHSTLFAFRDLFARKNISLSN